MENIYTIENTIGRSLERIWKKGQEIDTWESWNEVYITVRGMWLLGLYSDGSGDSQALEEYANMLMDVTTNHRLQARLNSGVYS